MRIDRKLNLVIPVDRGGVQVYVHSMPVSREVFETYFLVLSKTFAKIYQESLDITVGPRVAYLLLKKIAQDARQWETDPRATDGSVGVKEGLINEIVRLSNVCAPGKNGWEITQLQDVVDSGVLSEDQYGEIINALVFFTVVSHLHKKEAVQDTLNGMNSLWGISNTSSTCSEYLNTLQTSTKDESGGAKAA